MTDDVVLVTGRVMPRADTETPVLVEALRSRGLRVDVARWQDDRAWAAVPLVVVRTPWDYFDHLADFLAWARRVDGATTLVNPVQVLEWNSHQGYLMDLQAAGVPILPTVLVPKDASGADHRAALRIGREVVIKPTVSVGAIGALRCAAESVEATARLAHLTRTGDALVQPPGTSLLTEGELSLMFFGGVYSHAVRKTPLARDFRVQQRHGGSGRPHRSWTSPLPRWRCRPSRRPTRASIWCGSTQTCSPTSSSRS
jgi:hypothetical protein